MEFADKQWMKIEPVILESMRKKDPRDVLNGILWALRTDAPWKDLPERHPPRQTCRRRFQQWVKAGVFRRAVEELAAGLQARGRLDLREALADGSFVPAEKGALPSAGQNAAKAAGSWQLRTLPVFLPPPFLLAEPISK